MGPTAALVHLGFPRVSALLPFFHQRKNLLLGIDHLEVIETDQNMVDLGEVQTSMNIRVHQNIKKFSEFLSNLIYFVFI